MTEEHKEEGLEMTTVEFNQGTTGKKGCRIKVKMKDPEAAFEKATTLFKSALNNINDNDYE